MSEIASFTSVEGIAHAIRLGELHVDYQPIVNLESGGMLGAEALVRWTHPLLGEVPPSAFIPSAEDSGSIVAIGRFVLDAALTVAASWPRKAGTAPTYITINVTGRELREPDYASHVFDGLESMGVAPTDLKLEIIESYLDIDSPIVRANLDALRTRGVVIVVDDFGAGYSDHRRVEGTGASVIKIDRSLTATITGMADSLGTAPLATILNDAAASSLGVIAEGVESQAQATWYTDHGCIVGQGYLFGAAMSSDKLRKFLEGAPGDV